jgi:hypothetical protein
MKQFSLYSLSSLFMLHCNINYQSDILIFFTVNGRSSAFAL